MFAGHGPAELDRRVEELLEGRLGGAPGSVVAGQRDEQRVQVAVPGMAIVAIVTPCLAAIASIRASMTGTAERGTHTSSVSTGPSRSRAG